MTKNNVQKNPATSDEGQLTASTTPYLPLVEPQPEYVPPPRPNPVMGPGNVRNDRTQTIALAGDIVNYSEAQSRNLASIAAAKKAGG